MTKILMMIGIFTVAAIISPWLALCLALWIVWRNRAAFH